MRNTRIRIVISGLLDPGFADAFVGIAQVEDGLNTVLQGAFIDQSHLHGLLDQLRNLGVEVISFSRDCVLPEP